MIAEVTEQGLSAVGSMGQVVANPLLQRIEAANAEPRALEARLGLDPSARRRWA